MEETALAIVRHFCLLCAVLTPLELLVPAHREQGLWRRGSRTDLLYFFVSPFLINAGVAALLAGLAGATAAILPGGLRARLSAQPFALQLGEIFLLAELGGYFVHRASHRVSWLWRFHRVHHSAPRLDWLAAHRQHPLEAVWLLGIANLPIAVLGFSVEPLAWFVLLQKVYTAFLHANVRISYGRFTLVLASPQFHHWHHDAGPEADMRSYNYASTLPILDWLFGTYRVPVRGFPEKYGLFPIMGPDTHSISDDKFVPDSYLRQLLWPLLPERPSRSVS